MRTVDPPSESLIGTLADEYLEARFIVECFSVMTSVSSSDPQAIASNECLKLSWKVHLEIQRPNHIGLTSNTSNSRRSYNLSLWLVAGPCRNAHSAVSLGAIVFIERMLAFGVSDETIQIWDKDIDNEHAFGEKVTFHAVDAVLEVFWRVQVPQIV
ncbi:MAG: hypothetical protein ACREMU_10630 [Gemmatimonadaceae bacterium]